MGKEYYRYFASMWVPILRKQYNTGTYEDKRLIKNNVFLNIHLNEKEKEEIWEMIVKNNE